MVFNPFPNKPFFFRAWEKEKWIKTLPLTLSLLMTTPEAFGDSIDQDQTAQNMQSDL